MTHPQVRTNNKSMTITFLDKKTYCIWIDLIEHIKAIYCGLVEDTKTREIWIINGLIVEVWRKYDVKTTGID